MKIYCVEKNANVEIIMSQNLQNFAEIKKIQLDNLVDFEKCCKTRICLQKSVPIQPKTSNILPKFCQKLATTLRVRRRAPRDAQPPQGTTRNCGAEAALVDGETARRIAQEDVSVHAQLAAGPRLPRRSTRFLLVLGKL